MVKQFSRFLNKLIEQVPFEIGVVIIGLGFISLALRIFFKESWRMKNHSVLSWKTFVDSWAVIVMLFMMGFSILFKEF
ncbi:hypothetical protein [Patiriisocius marinus]|uniref:Uncharacterized protein n=1 Tax=Patiriisocius marinus TaxID=1397112 RepID=A0A5J4IMS2_9FLAO|nr:hypothetical protein [Patiriisocius marinus]GER58589.1 hypothetical protein ULMA_06970 [Patiriisocius marinus]